MVDIKIPHFLADRDPKCLTVALNCIYTGALSPYQRTWFANVTFCTPFSLKDEEKENLSALKHHFTFLHHLFAQMKMFRLLTTGPVGPALPLSPCIPAGPWNETQTGSESKWSGLYEKFYWCVYCVCHLPVDLEDPFHQEYQIYPEKHKETDVMQIWNVQLKRWIETTIITFEDHNIRRQIRTLVPTAPDSPLGPRRPTCPCWRLTQVSFSCFLQDNIIIYNFLHTFWSGSMHWYVSVWLTFCPFSPGWPGSPGNPLTPCIYTNNPISMNSPC